MVVLQLGRISCRKCWFYRRGDEYVVACVQVSWTAASPTLLAVAMPLGTCGRDTPSSSPHRLQAHTLVILVP